MKVILSRKGFDSENGGIPSPVFLNGDAVSLPIPSDIEKTTFADFQYEKIGYHEIFSELLGEYEFLYNSHCHFDPDLDGSRYVKKPKNWKPGFGQCSTSLSYLKNTVKIEPGDLFLFFGWFHFVEFDNQNLIKYIRKDPSYFLCHDFHLIWGYMQVGEILTDYKSKAKKLPWHPHSADYRNDDSYDDTIFVGSKHLSFAPDMPGAGILPFSDKRILTLEGKTKATWKYNKVYDPDHIIGSRKNSAKGDGIYYSGIWQELGLKESKAAEKWAKDMVLSKRVSFT